MDESVARLIEPSGKSDGNEDEEEEEDVKPYKIHVASKYLDLTRKKLELTRLPHEPLLPPVRTWENGTPKSEIEPLIDYWLETYSWRHHENYLNTTLLQYRTAIKAPGLSHHLKIHFLHIRSAHRNAIPLLLIPSFPLANLSLRPSLWKPLLEPGSKGEPAFHIIIPSIPGLGFSDAFTTTSRQLESTAEIFDALMKRLGYDFYFASGTGSGIDSPANIDYYLPRLLGEKFASSCLGVHLLGPPLHAPSLTREPWQWAKFSLAKFFHANVFGYEKADFLALRKTEYSSRKAKGRWRFSSRSRLGEPGYGGVGMLGLREPSTLAYALCDSPVGLLSLVSSALKQRDSAHTLGKEEIVNLTQFAWLPGPEAGLRYWSGAVREAQELASRKRRANARVAVTAFGADGVGPEYMCPAWAAGSHEIVFAQRASGRAGLVLFGREDVIVKGVRGLASAMMKLDSRLNIMTLEKVKSAAEDVTMEDEVEVDSPVTVVAFRL